MMAQAIKRLFAWERLKIPNIFKSQSEPTSKPRVVRLGSREIITEGLYLSFWTDISHRCMTGLVACLYRRRGPRVHRLQRALRRVLLDRGSADLQRAQRRLY